MVIDGFIFFNELDTLKLRMEILDPHVDIFVVTESDVTFSGKPKPFIFDENREIFKKFSHKIIWNPIYHTPANLDSWGKEIYQRNAIKDVIDAYAASSDIIITGDVDEIPDMGKALKFYDGTTLIHPLMKMFYYYVNVYKENNWHGSKICKYDFMKNITVDELRNMKDAGIKIPNCGWHFSFLGGVEKIKEKIGAFSHTEFDNPFIKDNIENNIENNNDLFFRNGKLVPISVCKRNGFPDYICENEKELSHLIKEV